MNTRWKCVVLAATCAAWLGLMMVAGAQQTFTATARQTKVGNRDAGQVLINGATALSLYDLAGEESLKARAEGVAARLNDLFAQKVQAKDITATETNEGWSLQASGLTIVTATQEDADALKTTPEKLVKFWRTSLTERMAAPAKAPAKIDPVKRDPAKAEPAKTEPAKSKSAPAANGDQYDKKIVPIVSVGQGIHLGAAEVVGPPAQVRKVKAVAQLEADFKKLSGTRIRALVPVSSENVVSNLSRVDRVAVSMYGDVDPRKIF